MKGIYLSPQGKEQLEAKIAELEKQINLPNHFPLALSGKLLCLKEILSSAIVLPVEKDWENVDTYEPDNETQAELTLRFKHGVIIEP